jgi:hypothetical protein
MSWLRRQLHVRNTRNGGNWTACRLTGKSVLTVLLGQLYVWVGVSVGFDILAADKGVVEQSRDVRAVEGPVPTSKLPGSGSGSGSGAPTCCLRLTNCWVEMGSLATREPHSLRPYQPPPSHPTHLHGFASTRRAANKRVSQRENGPVNASCRISSQPQLSQKGIT